MLMLSTAHIIAYFNPFKPALLQKPFYCCIKWVLMQSALGMVAAEITHTLQNFLKNAMK